MAIREEPNLIINRVFLQLCAIELVLELLHSGQRYVSGVTAWLLKFLAPLLVMNKVPMGLCPNGTIWPAKETVANRCQGLLSDIMMIIFKTNFNRSQRNQFVKYFVMNCNKILDEPKGFQYGTVHIS